MISKDDPHQDSTPSPVSAGLPQTGSWRTQHIWAQEGAIKRFFLLAIIIWSVMVALPAILDYRRDRETRMEIAKSSAHDTYLRDQLYRRWATVHGGVYVPVTPKTQPSHYLSHIPERDIVTPSGRELTLMDPAYMARQVYELGFEEYGLRGHITSLKPIRLENAPDAWEKEALLAFERGEKEVSSLESIDGQPYLRLMSPMITEQDCLKCHAELGYVVGDIRGGISVSVSWELSRLLLLKHLRSTLLGFGFAWLLGFSALYFARYSFIGALSEIRKGEESLIESNDRLRLTLIGARVGTWEWDLQTNENIWSEELCHLYGLDPHNCRPSYAAWLNTIHPDDRDGVEQTVIKASQSGAQLLAEWRVVHADGTDHWLMSNGGPMRNTDGKTWKYLGVVQDITEYKQAIKVLQKNEADQRERDVLAAEAEERRILLDNIPTLIWYLVDVQTFGAVNEAHAASYGKRKEDIAFKMLYDVLPKEVADICRQGNIEVFATGKPVLTEEWTSSIYGRERLLSISKVPKLRADGSVEYVVCSAEDITDRMRAEQAILDSNRLLEAAVVEAREMTVKAEAATIAKSRFLANMSHEIRTPLNAVIGFSQLMQSSTGLSAEQLNRLEIIHRSGEHLLGLINNILEFSRIEAGMQKLDPTTFDLHALIGDLATIFQQRAEDKNLRLVVEGLDHVPRYIVADEQKLRQVLINLLGNAIKFTQTGEIRLRVGTESIEQDRALLVVLVEDTGAGIEADAIGLLFEAFEQTESSRRTGGGTGLGLSISRGFARMMGGDVTITSEFGKGSVFRLEIPVREGTAHMSSEKIVPRRVLGIEDNQPPLQGADCGGHARQPNPPDSDAEQCRFRDARGRERRGGSNGVLYQATASHSLRSTDASNER